MGRSAARARENLLATFADHDSASVQHTLSDMVEEDRHAESAGRALSELLDAHPAPGEL